MKSDNIMAKAKIKGSPFEVDVQPHFSQTGCFDGFSDGYHVFAPEYLDFDMGGDVEVVPAKDPADPRNKILVDCGIPVRLYNAVRFSKFFFNKDADEITLGDIVSIPKTEFMKLRNFGAKSMMDLEDLLKRNGLKLS